MKRFTGVMCGTILLAAFLIILGTVFLLRPSTTLVRHVQTPTRGGVPKMEFVEAITPRESRIYGGLAIAFGIGLLCLCFVGRGVSEA